MVTAMNDIFLHFSESSPSEMMKQTLEEIYPLLFTEARALPHLLDHDAATDETITMGRLLDKLMAELDNMFRQEKFLLFPYIQQLLQQNKLSDSCAPFNMIKGHYSTMLRICAEIKMLEGKAWVDEGFHPLVEKSFFLSVTDFIDLLVQSHQAKEQYLYKPLKSCLGCKKP